MGDKTHMEKAIGLAENCKPVAERIPKVGAVIAIGDTMLARGSRGSGTEGDDDHAELVALGKIDDKSQLPQATLYTTLEPCTGAVRSDPSKCCTELILRSGIKKVFIGILDPNQGVTGKGLWELQSHKIDVELFPPELAQRIRAINDNFIRIQQTLGIRITNLEAGQTIRTWDKHGEYEVRGTFLNKPGADVFAFIGRGSQWWPQPHPLGVTGNESDRKWVVKVYFGSYGPHRICIVRANDLGASFVAYYRKICSMNIERERVAKEYFERQKTDGKQLLDILAFKYPAIELGALPKGIEVQDVVEIIVEPPPPTGLEIRQIS